MPTYSRCDICTLNPAAYVASRIIPARGGRAARFERWYSCIRCRDQAVRKKSRDITFTPIERTRDA